MRIPLQDITIVNNHPVDFQRRIWAKSHPRAGSILAKIHGKIEYRSFFYIQLFLINFV